MVVFSLCSISKCGLQVNTLKGISDGLSKPMLRLTALKYVVIWHCVVKYFYLIFLHSIASNPLGVTGSAVKSFVEKLPVLETVA